MSKLPRVSGKELIRFLQKRGFELVVIRGSHHKLRDKHNMTIVVPVHGNESVHIGTLHHIVTKKLKLTPKEFAEELRK